MDTKRIQIFRRQLLFVNTLYIIYVYKVFMYKIGDRCKKCVLGPYGRSAIGDGYALIRREKWRKKRSSHSIQRRLGGGTYTLRVHTLCVPFPCTPERVAFFDCLHCTLYRRPPPYPLVPVCQHIIFMFVYKSVFIRMCLYFIPVKSCMGGFPKYFIYRYYCLYGDIVFYNRNQTRNIRVVLNRKF